MVAFGFSPGDVILCAQIAHQLYSSLTDGRKTAPCDLKEVKGALFGLYCSLNHLHRVSQTILFRAERNPNQDAIFMRQDLGFMIRLCLQSLDELDQVTRKYQNAADDPPPLQYTAAGISFSTQFREQAKIHWRRFLWDLKRDSFCRYREKLQSHTDGINLLLNTFIWSATNRLEEVSRYHTQMMKDLLDQTSQYNNIVSQFMHNGHPATT